LQVNPRDLAFQPPARLTPRRVLRTPFTVVSDDRNTWVGTVRRMNETLMRVLEEFAAFLDLNGEEELRPDVAEWGRERLCTLVRDLTSEERAELVRFLEKERDESDGGYREWIEGLPDRLGLR
jgi:hypothetical protein